MNVNPTSDLQFIWDTYKDFEAFKRETDGDINHFIEEWKNKMAKVQSAGCQYSDLLLGLKLIEKANLNHDTIVSVISKLGPSNFLDEPSSESFFAQVVTNVKELSCIIKLNGIPSVEKTNSSGSNTNVQGISDALDSKSSLESYSAKFLKETSLPKVINSKNGPRSFAGFLKCPICDKNFILEDNLERHISNHTNSLFGFGEDSLVDQEWICSTENMKDAKIAKDKIKKELDRESTSQEFNIKNQLNDGPKLAKESGDNVSRQQQPDDKIYGGLRSRSSCDICGRVISNSNMNKHMVTHTREAFECNICHKEYNLFSLLKIHMDVHKTTKDHSCSYCDKKFQTKLSLYSHLSKKHRMEKKIGKKHCAKINSSGKGLKTYKDDEVKDDIKSETVQESDMKNVPDQNSISMSDLQKKYRTKKQTDGKAAPVPSRKFPCEICGRSIARNNMSVHIKAHFPEAFNCSICPKKYKKMSLLKKHLENHSQIQKVIECNVCQKQFSDACRLRIHMETHNTTRDYICSYCGKKYKTKMTLKEHMNLHTKAKPLPCKFCDKIFFYHASRKFHIRAHHTGEKPYKCDFCDKRFYTSTKKVEHTRYHTGEKPFPCHVCGKYFRESCTLKRHVRNIHKEVKLSEI